MFLLVHWWNNKVICQKKIHPPPDSPPPFVKFLISIIEKKRIEKYVEFNFRIGTVLEFSFLCNRYVLRMDRARNEEVRRRAGIERELASWADQRVLRWFGHVERMDEYRMVRRVLMAEVSGGRVRGRPRLGWMDGVKVALGNRGMTVEAARKIGKSGEPWYIVTEWVPRGHFAWHCVLLDLPSVLWWLSHGEGRDAVTRCGWDKLEKGLNYWKSRFRYQVYGLRGESWWLCVCFIWLDMTTSPCCREKVMVYYYIITVLVIFSFFWTDNAPCPSPFVNFFIS